jgi:hypothetical protein
MTMTEAHLKAVRDARFVAIAALTVADDKTHKTREEHQHIAALLSEACDYIEAALNTKDIEDLALLDWMAERTNIELFCHTPVYGDDDDLSVEWRVTQVNGGVNDREWTVIGKGATPAAAIRAALNAKDAA